MLLLLYIGKEITNSLHNHDKSLLLVIDNFDYLYTITDKDSVGYRSMLKSIIQLKYLTSQSSNRVAVSLLSNIPGSERLINNSANKVRFPSQLIAINKN